MKVVKLQEKILGDEPVIHMFLDSGQYGMVIDTEWLVFEYTGRVVFTMREELYERDGVNNEKRRGAS